MRPALATGMIWNRDRSLIRLGSKILCLLTEPCDFGFGDHAQATDDTDLASGSGPSEVVKSTAKFSVFLLKKPINVDVALVFVAPGIRKLLYHFLVDPSAITLQPDWA